MGKQGRQQSLLISGYTPVRTGEGTWLLQFSMQVGTEASEKVESKTLVGAGCRKVEENHGGHGGLVGSLQR